MAERRHQDTHGKTIRERSAQQSDPGLPACAKELIGTNGAGPKENQRKRAEKFSGKFLWRVVHAVASLAN
jgi:hypothetical protein